MQHEGERKVRGHFPAASTRIQGNAYNASSLNLNYDIGLGMAYQGNNIFCKSWKLFWIKSNEQAAQEWL